LRKKGIPLTGLQAPIERVGKLVMVSTPRAVPRREHARLLRFSCRESGTRAWNQALCDALEGATCDDSECTFVHHGNCSGFLAGAGRFVTAAHCLADLVEAPARLSASHVLVASPGAAPRRLAIRLATLGKREFSRHWVSERETPVDVAILLVDDGGLEAYPTARVAPDEVLAMVGYPRAELRSQEARKAHGYGLFAGTLAVSFGRVDDPNLENRPLCSVDGRQEHWRLHQACPFGAVTVEGEPAWKGVLLTGVFTSTMDSINGFSGAPVFNARGEWVGVNSTILSSENPQRVYPPGFRAVATQVDATTGGRVGATP
jgi:hypothetical protein